MPQTDQSQYVTHDHIKPIHQKLREHSDRFQVFDEWKGGVDRRISGFDKSLVKLCETMTGTEAKVTTRQDALSAQQADLSRKLDGIAGDNGQSKVKIESISKTLDAMALADAEERGRKAEREINEAEKRASFSRKIVTIGAIYTLLQIVVILTSYFKSV